MTNPRLTLAVAGHVDHGKTALTRALTGVDTDRLPEERARGLSIQPGFAELELPSGRRVSVIDVPGHERFVRHMIGGSSGVDGAILCVAADDGVMPQTREHLDVLRLLRVPVVLVAITFADRADTGAAAAEVAAAVGAPIFSVVAPDDAGVAALRAELDRRVAGLSRRTGEGPPRLPVDRCFTVRGAGTVVTGTLWGGAFAQGDAVRVEPGGALGRLRRLEVHDREAERASGGRVALNLAGVDREAVPRGSTVVRAADTWSTVDRVVVDLEHLAASPRPLRGRERLQAFLGTAEVPARLRLLDAGRGELAPSEVAPVELRLERAVLVVPGDPVILRSADPTTIAGGLVVSIGEPRDVRPSPPSTAHVAPPPTRTLDAVAAALMSSGRGGATASALSAQTDMDTATLLATLSWLRRAGRAAASRDRWFDERAVQAARDDAVATWHVPERTLGDLRATWGVNRQAAEALAMLLDARGVTQRRGGGRVLRRGASLPANARGSEE